MGLIKKIKRADARLGSRNLRIRKRNKLNRFIRTALIIIKPPINWGDNNKLEEKFEAFKASLKNFPSVKERRQRRSYW